MSNQSNRRTFLKTAAASSLILAAPAVLSAKNPQRVRVAGIGVGGKGWTDINGAAAHADVVAFCDVETGNNRRGGYQKAAETWPKANAYTDYRELIEKEHKNLDGVTISTPDHMHAPISLLAMQHGLAVYTQKPLTRTVSEARDLTNAAARHKVITQMGNQGHSGSGYRTVVKMIQSGAIGKIKEAHTWSNRPIWPQGIDRPTGSDPIPKGFDWNLWLGVANERPYKKDVYHPFKWRGWYDFGAGALGDMGCHIIDPVVWSLELGAPKSVSYNGPEPNAETFPEWEILTYQFDSTKYTVDGGLTMKWYDGGKQPSLATSHIEDKDMKLPTSGVLLVGEEGTLLCKHGGLPALHPLEKFADTKDRFEKRLDHYGVWINGIRTGEQANSNFAYAGPLTETVLLGVIASRVGEGKLEWDAEKMQFTNSPAATKFVTPEYRKGWH